MLFKSAFSFESASNIRNVKFNFCFGIGHIFQKKKPSVLKR
jgi:hypothetical protein